MSAFAAATVVKLGGSLLAARPGEPLPALSVMRAIAAAERPVVVVPGGGPFADAVRSAQSLIGYSDDAAHAMALHAMVQTGLALVDLARADGRFELLGEPRSMAALLARGGFPVWDPLPLSSRADGIGRDWSVTSDALAAWLSRELGASGLALVKSCAVPADARLDALADAGIVDRVCVRIVDGSGLRWAVLHHGELDRLSALLGA